MAIETELWSPRITRAEKGNELFSTNRANRQKFVYTTFVSVNNRQKQKLCRKLNN